MNYKSVFDIIGPVMVGPSSSHTAGAVRIGYFAREVFGKTPKTIKACFYGSFAETYQGHGTDVAIIAGLLGFETSDPNIPNAIEIAKEQGIHIDFVASHEDAPHPNTARLVISDDTHSLGIVGISIGGGSMQIVEINDFKLDTENELKTYLVVHNNTLDKIDDILQIFNNAKINVNYKDLSIKGGKSPSLTILYTSDNLDKGTITEIEGLNEVFRVLQMN